MTNTASAEISLSALRHNLSIARQSAPNSQCMAVIKADAYGHGILNVASTLEQADAFAVARLEEASALRQAGITKRIVILEGVQTSEELDDVCAHKLDIVIHHDTQLKVLLDTALNEPVSVWIKLDTGMHRLGFQTEQFSDVVQSLQSCHWVKQPLHVMTHFACADDINDAYTEQQITTFKQATNDFSLPTSMANSAATLSKQESHADWIRPGIMLYGSCPFINGNANDLQLKPVMTLRSKLIAINNFQMGDHIGYGATYTCDKDKPVGVVAIGYGDGYPRHATTGTPVWVNGKRCALLGRVSMDMISVDLSPCPEVKVGEDVELWGENISVDEVARYAGTIAYELLCGVTQRVTKIYKD